jgi:G patch domain/KOW motif-containing protein
MSYLQVEGIDEDNARVVIKLTLSSSVITLNQMAVRLVTKKDYDKNSKYLSEYQNEVLYFTW